jgi:hypothetical protein
MTLINQFVFDVLVAVAYLEIYLIFVPVYLTKPNLLMFNEDNAIELQCVGTVTVNGEGGYI